MRPIIVNRANAMPRNLSSESKKARLLVVSPWGVGGGYCGPVVLMDRLFGELKRRHDVQIDVLYRNRGEEIVPPWVSRSFSITAGNRESFGRRAQVAWGVRAAAFLARQAANYQCVHLHGAYWATLFPALFDSRTSLSVLPVLEAGDLSPGRFPQNWAQRFLRQRAAAKTIALFSLSDGIAREAREAGWLSDLISPIGNPVDGNFHPVPRRLPTKAGVRIGFAGKLGPTKRPDRILAAVRAMVNDGIEASAIFVGPYANPNYERYFNQQITDFGLRDRITVTGYTNDVASFMKQAMDIFVLPSLAEGMPGALAEAMSCGLPAIVTDVGEMANVAVSSKAGIVIDGTPEAIVAATKRIIAEANLYKTMSEGAAAYAALHYSAAAIADQFFQRVFSAESAKKKLNTISGLDNAPV